MPGAHSPPPTRGPAHLAKLPAPRVAPSDRTRPSCSASGAAALPPPLALLELPPPLAKLPPSSLRPPAQ
jgi:hypothetical protein